MNCSPRTGSAKFSNETTEKSVVEYCSGNIILPLVGFLEIISVMPEKPEIYMSSMAVPIKGRLKDGLGGYVSCTIVETDLSFLGTISMW